MQKLISELIRLYMPTGALAPEILESHVRGQPSPSVSLVTGDGRTRAIVIGFHKMANSDETEHWRLLCVVANALQVELDLPAPAVSISGSGGYGLWLSLEAPASTVRVQKFLQLLHSAYFPSMDLRSDAATAPLELPPCQDPRTGKWAAFIHPALGASFADESGLEMAPPLAGQAALLESLQSISEAQFQSAMNMLEPAQGATPAVSEPLSESAATPGGLLLKNATLEDIVKYLHSKNIEPTFRHLLPEH
jgi:hypothetical protein